MHRASSFERWLRCGNILFADIRRLSNFFSLYLPSNHLLSMLRIMHRDNRTLNVINRVRARARASLTHSHSHSHTLTETGNLLLDMRLARYEHFHSRLICPSAAVNIHRLNGCAAARLLYTCTNLKPLSSDTNSSIGYFPGPLSMMHEP